MAMVDVSMPVGAMRAIRVAQGVLTIAQAAVADNKSMNNRW